MAKPKLIVFDLDYTLWPFWVDTHVDPPFHKDSNGKIFDANGQRVNCYSDVPQMLEQLHAEGYVLGLASRTTYCQEAKDLVELFGWNKYVTQCEIYPGTKIPHFKSFHEKTGFAYKQMLFFDDEYRNVRDVSTLGVTCVHAENGMDFKVLKQGLEMFAKNQKSQC